MDGVKTRVPAWFPEGLNWEDFVRHAPVEMRTRLQGPEVQVQFDGAWAADRLRDLLSAGKYWRNIVNGVRVKFYKNPTAFDSVSTRMVEGTILLARLSPATDDPFHAVLEREGRKSITVPSAEALLAGFVWAGLRDGVPRTTLSSSMRRVLNELVEKWYEGDKSAMARDMGIGEGRLNDMIDHPEIHSRSLREFREIYGDYNEVRRMAKGLGVDPRKFDIAWFVDKYGHVLASYWADEVNADARIMRAQILMNMASMRMGNKISLYVNTASNMRDTVTLAVLAMHAGFHPKTVIPLIAAVHSHKEGFYSAAMAYAVQLCLGHGNGNGDLADRLLRAAVACFLASEHAGRNWGKPARMIAAISQGNTYLDHYLDRLMSLGEWPQALGLNVFSDSQRLYAQRAIELDRRMPAMKVHPSIVTGLREYSCADLPPPQLDDTPPIGGEAEVASGVEEVPAVPETTMLASAAVALGR